MNIGDIAIIDDGWDYEYGVYLSQKTDTHIELKMLTGPIAGDRGMFPNEDIKPFNEETAGAMLQKYCKCKTYDAKAYRDIIIDLSCNLSNWLSCYSREIKASMKKASKGEASETEKALIQESRETVNKLTFVNNILQKD